jgi:hypothetical protein
MHLLIPFAASHADAARAALTQLQLPQLERLLQRLTLVDTDTDRDDSRSPPHERALARAWGLPVQDGRIAWAAHSARMASGPQVPAPGAEPWAWITLCHWQARSGRISLSDPQQLAVTPAQSQALLDAMRPYFAEDGITLTEHRPGLWLARGAPLQDLVCASLDRVVGRRIDAWMPQGAGATLAHRLQNEMQMLLYTHPVNDARSEHGQLPVNSFWIHGAGALPADLPAADPQAVALVMPLALRDAAVREDWSQWTQAWAALDAGPVARALAQVEQGLSVTLTLCGERSAQRFELRPRTRLRRITQYFRRAPVQLQLSQL